MPQEDIRCPECRRLLFRMEADALAGDLSIKCPRCKSHLHMRPSPSPNPERRDRVGKELTHARLRKPSSP